MFAVGQLFAAYLLALNFLGVIVPRHGRAKKPAKNEPGRCGTVPAIPEGCEMPSDVQMSLTTHRSRGLAVRLQAL